MTQGMKKKSEEVGRVSSNYTIRDSAKKEGSYQKVKLGEDYTSICDERKLRMLGEEGQH